MNGRLFGELFAAFHAHTVDHLAFQQRVWSGKVDVLEDAERWQFVAGRPLHDGQRLWYFIFGNFHDFARLKITVDLCTDAGK